MGKKPVRVTFMTKPGCHLCDEAREIIDDVVGLMGRRGIAVNVDEVNILDEPALARLHSEEIPVVFIGRRRHSIWRVDRDRFTAAVEKASRGGLFA